MRKPTPHSARLLPDGTLLHNRLLAALPRVDYTRVLTHLRMNHVKTGQTLQDQTTRLTDVYFPNGGVFSVTMNMRNGTLVEVATVGCEGMLGIGAFFGDRTGTGRTFQQVADGALPSMTVGRFIKEAATPGPFRAAIESYARANLRQIMQCAACNALHDVTQRCCRWLLETHDRVESDDFPMKQEFLAIMLGVRRPTVTVVMQTLHDAGLISNRYGRIRILKRKQLEASACECYRVIRLYFARLEDARLIRR
jgi:CRP-like cAMP-binding protein